MTDRQRFTKWHKLFSVGGTGETVNSKDAVNVPKQKNRFTKLKSGVMSTGAASAHLPRLGSADSRPQAARMSRALQGLTFMVRGVTQS